MKKAVKLFGIIALVAVIGVWMTACDDNDEFDNGDNREQVTITFSIDKIDARTFTVTQEGSKWNSSMDNGLYSGARDHFDENTRMVNVVATNGQTGSVSVTIAFDVTRTDTVLTYVLVEGYSSVSGTITLNNGSPNGWPLILTCLDVFNEKNTVIINPAKSSITF